VDGKVVEFVTLLSRERFFFADKGSRNQFQQADPTLCRSYCSVAIIMALRVAPTRRELQCYREVEGEASSAMLGALEATMATFRGQARWRQTLSH